MIATNILQYINYLGDVDYLASIVNSTSAAKLSSTIDEILRLEDEEKIGLTCLFIRDFVLSSSQHPALEEFVKNYLESSIVKTLEQLLFYPNHFIRKQAVYTLGKTCSYSSVSVLDRAFNAFRDSDPILLPRLIGEMGWLGSENFWTLLDSMMSSQVYMTRWAVIAVLSEFIGDDAMVQNELCQNKFRCLDRLRQDSNVLIRSEAEYEYQLLKFRSETGDLPKSERKKKWKQIVNQYKPKFYFTAISSAFTYHLHNNELTQYSVANLETFVSALTQSGSVS